MGFHRMPWLVVLATGLALFHTWVLFAELVVDRYGLWSLLPGYSKGDVCVYEPLVALAIVVTLAALTRRDRRRAATDASFDANERARLTGIDDP
jgi:hypothetical protein